MADGAVFYYQNEFGYEEKAAKKFLKEAALTPLKLLAEQLEPLDPFNEENLENAFKNVMESADLKFGKIAQPVRVALTGKTVSPGIFEIIEVLGKEQSIKRLNKAIQFIEKKNIE